MKLRTNTLFKISKLFESKNWRVENQENVSSLFYRYCERLKLLDEDEQDFIIELSQNYERVELSIYLESFYESLILLGDEIFEKYENIYIFPLLKPNTNYSKTKSAGFLHYMLDSDEYRWLSENLIVTYRNNNLKRFDSERDFLVFIDDFVGSGDTVIESISAFLDLENFKQIIPVENIRVVSIAAQEFGIENVKANLSIDVITNKVLKRGISDYYDDFEIKKNFMRQISKKIGIDSDMELGYKECESLITMLQKTPNNTFPVYWKETRNKVAPFPRKKYYKKNG